MWRAHRVLLFLAPLERLRSREPVVARVRRRRDRHALLGPSSAIRGPASALALTLALALALAPVLVAVLPTLLPSSGGLSSGEFARLGALGGSRCILGQRVGDIEVVLLALAVARLVLVAIGLGNKRVVKRIRTGAPVRLRCGRALRLSRSFAGPSSTTTKPFWRERWFHLSADCVKASIHQ